MEKISKLNIDGTIYEIADTLAMEKITKLESDMEVALNDIINIQNELIGETGGDGE